NGNFGRRQDTQQQQRQEQDKEQQQQTQQQQTQQRFGQRGGSFGGRGGAGTQSKDGKIYSPDNKAYVFIRNHNLYLVETTAKSIDSILVPALQPGFANMLGNVWAVTRGSAWLRENKAIQLSNDSAEDYSFGRMAVFGAGMDDAIGPPRVEWAKDSKSFYATRTDTRGVQELFLVNSLSTPRPTLEKYKYPMPGEDAARKMELFVCDRAAQKLVRITPKWKDEAYSDMHWGKTTEELRFVRRDRLWRHSELCSTNVRTGETRCLILEGFENANISTQPPRYIDETDEMVWWSERSGWGHFYLYDRNGKFKNQITSGLFRASRIVDIDAKNRVLYFRANGREPGESV